MPVSPSTTVISVFVIMPERAMLLDVAGPVEVLRRANLEQSAIRFEVSYIGPAAKINSSAGLTIADIAPLPVKLPDNALVMVPGTADQPLHGPALIPHPHYSDPVDKTIVSWLARTIKPGIRLMAICSGAMLAARAGLLKGYACTTHHAHTSALAKLEPEARVHDNRLYVEDRDRFTSAGITAGIDLMLHFVAISTSIATTVKIARHMVIYLRRAGSDPQLSPWAEGRNHLHPAIHRVQDAIAANPADPWSLSQLAKLGFTSARNLSRLFNEQTGMSVTDYVNRMRLLLAKELLLNSRLDMEQIAERSGFNSARQFRRVWNNFYHHPPTQARRSQLKANV